MTGHCKDCRWWDVVVMSTPGPCRHPLNIPHGGIVEQKESGMTFHYSDCADDGKRIITGPDFGCIHHEPHNPPSGDGSYAYPHDVAGEKESEK